MTNRKLTLKRENLSSLATDDLQEVVGASVSPSCRPTCVPLVCNIAIAGSVKPTCQETICAYCPR